LLCCDFVAAVGEASCVVSDAFTSESESQRPGGARRNGVGRGAAAMARRLGLRLVASDALSIRRRRRGKGWSYLHPDGRVIRDRVLVARLARLAVPPAYEDVLYAADARAHLQAIGRDASPASPTSCRASAAASVSISPPPRRRANSRSPL
jgi:hypothetical protein